MFLIRVTESPLAVLHAMAKIRDILVQYEKAAVEEARERGDTWEQIAEALGRSRQSVWRQYGP
jgi:hypothetical protein